MPDESSGFFRSLSSYANEWIETKRKNLQAKPQTQVDRSGGYSIGFSKQEITQSELREVRRMRESGGLIATAFHSKALIKFGGGVEFQAEDDELENWLEDTLDGIDNLILDMGEDALWYPYSLGEIVETRTGDFSHIECIEPWTMLPETDEYGDIVRWQQKLQGGQTDIFEPEEIGSIILNKASGRDKTGISEALRNREEIEAFRAYQKSIREVDERIGFPFRHVKAGRDGGAQLNDQQLRRIRNRTNDIGAGETLTTGWDIEIDHENPMEGVDTSNIQERNMRMLATALGLPIELLNEGSDGLGSGMPAELRKELLALQNEADRRRIDDQFTEQFLRPIVKQYSDFDHTQDMGLTIAPFLDKKRDMAELISSVGEYMTTNEVREKLDMAPVDDEMGESYRSPADQEEPEDEGGPGLFRQARALNVPDNAVSISDRSEAPDDASIVTGPGGGLYYVPAGEADTDDGGAVGVGTIDSPNKERMAGFARDVAKPDNAEQAQEMQNELFDELGDEYGRGEVIQGRGTTEDGTRKFTMHSAFEGWESAGYWSSDVAPVWFAAQEATGRDAAMPEGMAEEDPAVVTRENFVDGTEDAIQDVIAFSQEFVANNMEGDTVPVSRGINDELAQQAIEAKQNGESLEIDPRAMESWSTDTEAAEEWGEVVVQRELTPEEVAFYGPAVIPDEFDDQEITALGVEPYEIDPDDIQILE